MGDNYTIDWCLNLLLALRDPTRRDHVEATKSLEIHKEQTMFALHMLGIFSGRHSLPSPVDPPLRQLAGLVIKNYVFPLLTVFQPEAIKRICEDSPVKAFGSEAAVSSRPTAAGHLLPAAAQPLLQHMNSFIQILAFLSSDSSAVVRRAVCQ
eukprot:gene31711-42292_t